MKKNQVIFTLLLLFAVGIMSCKKDKLNIEEPAPESSILKKSAVEQVKYAQQNLTKVASGLAKLAKNAEFVNFVHSEAAKKFDGEYEVLIETLKENPRWATLLNTPEINEGLNAFKNLEGQNLYPQIYIPKMQNDEENNASRGNNLIGDIKFVPFGGELPTDSIFYPNGNYPSLQIGANDSLESGGIVNEVYANENEVWIVSLNENVNSLRLLMYDPCGGYNPGDEPCGGGGGGGSGSGSGGTGSGSGSGTGADADPIEFSREYHPDMNLHLPINIKIENMIVRQHKESWVAGWSEIAIRAVLNTYNGRDLGNPSAGFKEYKSTQVSGLGGIIIKQFTNKEIRRQTSKYVNYTLQNGWPTSQPFSDPIYFDYVIFEKDAWPQVSQDLFRQNFVHSSNNFTDSYSLPYRSANTPYDIGRIINNSSMIFPPTNPVYYNNGSSNGFENSITFNVKPF